MSKKKKTKAENTSTVAVHWKAEPDDHDYPNAFNYLSLVVQEGVANATVNALEKATISHREAKDLLRSSGLPLLPKSNFHVSLDSKKISSGEKLSPVLLVRGSLSSGTTLTVADGYHRICASYYVQEDATIPCRLVDFIVPSTRQRSAAGSTPSK